MLQLVPQQSACLPGHMRSGLNARHGMLNKFATPDDEAFETVSYFLRDFAQRGKDIYSFHENTIQLIMSDTEVRPDGHRKTRAEVMRSLYATDYLDRMNRNPTPVEGTCEWFTGHHDFEQWQESKSSAMLWVSANPGCGKSVLAKHLVGYLQSPRHRTVCYFFFKEDFEDQRSAAGALRCILHQLFKQRPELLTGEIIERFESRNVNLIGSVDELWVILVMASQHENAGEIMCVLDALDECDDRERGKLTKALREFYDARSDAKGITQLKFLITSRPYDKVRRDFEPLDIPGISIIHLKGDAEEELLKIERDIKIYTAYRVSHLRQKLALTKDEESLLLESLQRVRNQTYLWVVMTLKWAEDEINLNKDRIRKITSSLPSTINEVYQKTLNKSFDYEETKKLLHIVVAAARPLTLAEMNFAMALRQHHTCYSDVEQNQMPEDRFYRYVRDLCGLFVNIIDSKIYLFHQTAKEFLVHTNNLEDKMSQRYQYGTPTWKASLKPSESNSVISQICIQQLLFPEFEARSLDTALFSFFDYSAANWATHFRASETEDTDIIDTSLRLCDTGSLRYSNWFRAYWESSSSSELPRDFTSLMAASYFGIERAVKLLLRGERRPDITAEDSTYQRTALSWASENGFDGVVGLLLQAAKWRLRNFVSLSRSSRANVNSKDVFGRSALFYAVLNGNAGIVLKLVQAGAQVDLEDDIGGTPLSYALATGEEAIAKMLTGRATKDTMEGTRRNLLLSATRSNDSAIIKRFLETGASTEMADEEGWTPLLLASSRGHKATVELLLTAGANIEARDRYGLTPLLRAVISQKGAIIQLLLQAGANIEAHDNGGSTPLLHAVTIAQNEAITKLLLEAGADTEARDKKDSTPLLHAVIVSQNEAIIKLLLQANADVEARDCKGRTPLSRAVARQNEAVVKIMLQAGANVEAQDDGGLTPLSRAIIISQNTAIIKLLLQAGANTKAQDFHGSTPISHAMARGNEAVIQIVLQAGVDTLSIYKDDRSDDSDITDTTDATNTRTETTDATTWSSTSALSFDPYQAAAETLARYLYSDSDLRQLYVNAIQKFGTSRFSNNHDKLFKIFMKDLRLASTDSAVREAVGFAVKRRSRALITRHVITLLEEELIASQEHQESMQSLLNHQDARNYTLGRWLNLSEIVSPEQRMEELGSDDSNNEEEQEEEEDDENNQDDQRTKTAHFESLVDVLLGALTSGLPFVEFKSNLACFTHPPTTISEALKLENLRALRRLLRKHFDSVATGEYAWIKELRELGHSRNEIADILLEDSTDSPWIFSINDEELSLQLAVQVHHHLPGCVHNLPWPQHQPDESINTSKESSRPQNFSSALETVQRLCGLAGIFPSSRDREDWNGSVAFANQNSVAVVSYTHPDITQVAFRVTRVLELFCTALSQAQSAGLCCESFTILTQNTSTANPRDDAMIEVCRVAFELPLQILDAVRHLASHRNIRNDDIQAASKLLKTICPGTENQRFFESSDRLAFLHMCSLSIQIMSLGFQSYVQAHVGPFHPSFLDTALQEIRLLGCEPSLELYPVVELQLKGLTCVGDMLQGPVLVFEMLPSAGSIPSIKDSEPGNFDLLASCEDLIDTWGPGQFVVPTAHSKYPSAVCIGGGVICVSDPASNRFHWSRDASSEKLCQGALDPASKIRIGTVELNSKCRIDEAQCRTKYGKLLQHLGPYTPCWELEETQIGGQGGMHFLVQANATFKRYPGRTLKQEILDEKQNWNLISFIEEHWAVQVSLCTGVARRVPLREMIADLLPIFANSISAKNDFKHWQSLKNKHNISSAFETGDLRSWLRELAPALHDLVMKIVRLILNALSETGLDRKRESLLVSWPYGAECNQCLEVSLSQRESSWAQLIADSKDCATFAYVSPKCLQTAEVRCSGTATSWRNAIPVLETVVMICPPRGGGPTTSVAMTSKLRHDETYYFETFDGSLFVRVQKPNNASVIKVVQKSSNIPDRVKSRLFGRAQRLRERRVVHEDGETVFILA